MSDVDNESIGDTSASGPSASDKRGADTGTTPGDSPSIGVGVAVDAPSDVDDELKRQEDFRRVATRIRELRESCLSKEWDVLERPYPIAQVFADGKRDKMDLREHDFEGMVSAYYGLVMLNWVEPYVALYDRLTAASYTSPEKKFEFANDAYVWACVQREVEPEKMTELEELFPELAGYEPPKHLVKVFVLETQSRNFVVVLNQCYGRWSVHIRQFWDDLAEARKSKYYFPLADYKDRRDLTLDDVVKLAREASDKYSDDLPGVSYPHRPMLATFLKGSLMAGEEEAGIGLRYGDHRDRGYIVSFKCDARRPEVDNALTCVFHDVSYVAYNLASAIDCLNIGD